MKLYKIKRPLRLTFVLLFVIGGALGLSVFYATNSDIIKIKSNDLKEVFSSKDLQTNVDEDETIQISSMDDIDKAIAFLPRFCVPEYIPEGYSLRTLEINKMEILNSYFARYHFSKNEEDYFLIHIRSTPEQGLQAVYDAEGKWIELKDRNILKWLNPVENTYGVNVVDVARILYITGSISHEEMMRIAEGLKLY